MKTIVKKLLFEAYRRNQMCDDFEKGKPLEKRWLGLGTEAAYRPALEQGLMAFHDGRVPPKRCMGWLVLTQEGIKAMEKLEEEFKTVLDDMVRSGYLDTLLANYQMLGGITCTFR